MLMLSLKDLPVERSLVKMVNGRMNSSEKWKFCKQAFVEQQNRLKKTSVKHLEVF